MRIKKTLKIAAIALGILLILLLLFVTAFIWNPTEGDLPDMRDIVPRNVDFFVRKTDLREDFAEFPEPAFWEEFADTPHWRGLEKGPLVRDINRSGAVTNAVEQLREVSLLIEDQSGGALSLLDDLVGTELIIAGRYVPPSFERSRFVAFTRVSWKVRFLWGLLGWGSVRESLAGLEITAEENGTLVVMANGQAIHLARRLDCVMVANDADLLRDALTLADDGGDSFGASASYRDGIQSRLVDWSELYPEYATNAIETYTRPDEMFNLTSWDDGWPNPRARDDMNQRVLASFLNLKAWRFFTSSLLFQPGKLSVQSRIELNRNEHTGFQSEFFRAESRPYSEWLTPFLALVPEGVGDRGACAAAAMRMDAANFLLEMYETLEDRSLIDDPLRKTGKYSGARELIDKLRVVLLPRMGFVFMRQRDLRLEVFEPSPAPHVAWVFWIRPDFRHVIEELRDFLTQYKDSIGFTKVTDLDMQMSLSDKCREFCSPHIPGTGEIAMLIYRDFFVLSNSSFLVTDMIRGRLESQSLLETDPWLETCQRELPSHVNAFAYVNGQRLANVFEDYVRSFGAGVSDQPDPAWMVQNRPRIERKVFEEGYRRYGSKARIPSSELAEFDAAVDRGLDKAWLLSRSKFTAADREFYQSLYHAAKSVGSAYLQAELDPQFIQLTSSILMASPF